MDERRLRYLAALSAATGSTHFEMPEVQTGEALLEPLAEAALMPALSALYRHWLTAPALRWGDEVATAESIEWSRILPSFSGLVNELWERKRGAAKKRNEPIWMPSPRPELEYLPAYVLTNAGWISLENDYVPRVVSGELPSSAYPEAKAALAIAARTFLARAMRDHPALGTLGPVPSGTGFQVMASSADPVSREAAARTRGVVMLYEGRLILANHVAGALVGPDGVPGKDPTGTQKWVTYNAGLRGSSVRPTGLALRTHSGNRGCMSQHGAMWLAEHGADRATILRFFYGDDVELRRLEEGPRQTEPTRGGASLFSSPLGAILIAVVGAVLREGR